MARPGEVNFSILSGAPAQSLGQTWKPILDDMAAQTGMKVRPFFSANYALLVERMKARKTDVGWFSNLSGLAAVRRANGEVFARTFEATGADGYTSILIVNARSKLTLGKVLRCDRTLSLGMGDPFVDVRHAGADGLSVRPARRAAGRLLQARCRRRQPSGQSPERGRRPRPASSHPAHVSPSGRSIDSFR